MHLTGLSRRATAFILDPEELAKRFPDVPFFQNPDTFFYQLFAGVASGFVYTLFFSFCPQIFKAIANYEGNVSSMRRAEDKALSYFWYFMLLTAFTGTSLAQMLYQGFTQGLTLGKELKEVLREVAATIPTQLAPVWINWISKLEVFFIRSLPCAFLVLTVCLLFQKVIRFTYTLPFLYFFQANTFGFSIIKWPWCGRLMRGG